MGHSRLQTIGGLEVEIYHDGSDKLKYVEIHGKGVMDKNGNENFWGFPGLLSGLEPSFRGCGYVLVYKFKEDEAIDGLMCNGQYCIKCPTSEETIQAICDLADDLVRNHENNLTIFEDKAGDMRDKYFYQRGLEKGIIKINSEYKWLEDVVNLHHFDGMVFEEIDDILKRIAYTLIRQRAKFRS